MWLKKKPEYTAEKFQIQRKYNKMNTFIENVVVTCIAKVNINFSTKFPNYLCIFFFLMFIPFFERKPYFGASDVKQDQIRLHAISYNIQSHLAQRFVLCHPFFIIMFATKS